MGVAGVSLPSIIIFFPYLLWYREPALLQCAVNYQQLCVNNIVFVTVNLISGVMLALHKIGISLQSYNVSKKTCHYYILLREPATLQIWQYIEHLRVVVGVVNSMKI